MIIKRKDLAKTAVASTILYVTYQIGKAIGYKEGSDKTSDAFYRMNEQILDMERDKRSATTN